MDEIPPPHRKGSVKRTEVKDGHQQSLIALHNQLLHEQSRRLADRKEVQSTTYTQILKTSLNTLNIIQHNQKNARDVEKVALEIIAVIQERSGEGQASRI